MTRWCRPDKIMQRSGAAAVHILIENVHKFKDFGVKKLIAAQEDDNAGAYPGVSRVSGHPPPFLKVTVSVNINENA